MSANKASWESVDTVIRQLPNTPAQPVKAVSFSGNLDPQTNPSTMVFNGFSGGLEPKTNPTNQINIMSLTAQPLAHGSMPGNQTLLGAHGKILAVFGCRGGAGATMISVNLAASLARQGKSVCLVDLDLQLGDVFVALDMEANTSISALARECKNLDGAQLRRRLQRHDSGVYALSQTGRLDDVDPELAERMPALFETLCEHFDYVVVDGVRDFGDHALTVLDMADRIAMVVTQDVQAVRRASRVMQLFRRLEYADSKVHVIINRQTAKAPVAESEIERVLGTPVTASIRNDYGRLRAALDEGALLHDVARGAGVTKDVERVAKALFEEHRTRHAIAEKPGFFTRLGQLFGGRGDK